LRLGGFEQLTEHRRWSRPSLSIDPSLKLLSNAQSQGKFQARKGLARSERQKVIRKVRVNIRVPYGVMASADALWHVSRQLHFTHVVMQLL
jgi:hypothetical protein